MSSASDNFDRANGEIGANWTEDNADIDVVSNTVESQTFFQINRARYTATQMATDDHFTQADCGGRDTATNGSITCRQASSTDTLYEGVYEADSSGDGYQLRKVIAGSETILDTAASASGQLTFKLTVDGATQSLEVSSSEVCSDTDSDITTGKYCGIRVWSDKARWDNWSAADLGAPPAAPAQGLFMIISKLKLLVMAIPLVGVIRNNSLTRRESWNPMKWIE